MSIPRAKLRLHFICTTFNRRETTTNALDRLETSACAAGINFSVTICDDQSSDGTADAVDKYEFVRTIHGSGQDYWATGMARAEQRAIEIMTQERDENFSDYIVWINDDVVLDPDALTRAADYLSELPDVWIGAMRSKSGSITYSGYKKAGVNPIRMSQIPPGSKPIEVYSFNGNLVFIPIETIRRLGGIDGEFSHAWADVDFGLRLHEAGTPASLLPGTYGECDRNPESPPEALLDSWRKFTGPKGSGHRRSLWRIYKKHTRNRATAALFFAGTYIGWLTRNLRQPSANIRGGQ